MPWFTNYPKLDFDPARPECRYSETFATQLTLINTAFRLKRHSRGVHVSTGYLRACTFQRKNVHIEVKRFAWLAVRRYSDYVTPVFTLQFIMQEDRRSFFKNLLFEGRVRPFFTGRLIVEFPPGYPQSKPHLRLDDPHYTSARGSVSHHVHAGGWLCIMANSAFWNPKTCTIVTALDAAFDWVVWHRNTFGSKGVKDA